jgi:glucose-6-phosphate dehydrogenase assembly protein OpcA
VRKGAADEIEQVSIELVDGHTILAINDAGRLILRRTGQQDSISPFADRSAGELLAEELRRLDVDFTYAEALSTVTGIGGLNDRSGVRTHIWKDPALAEGAAN